MSEGFKGGDSSINRNGRPKGALNKTTLSVIKVRELFAEFIGDNFGQMNEDFQSLSPELRIRFYIEMCKFCIPTMRATTHQIHQGDVPAQDIVVRIIPPTN
jgi:hypothetical protein